MRVRLLFAVLRMDPPSAIGPKLSAGKSDLVDPLAFEMSCGEE